MGAVLCFAVMGASVKYGGDHHVSAFELLFYRNLISFPMILLWIWIGPGFRIVRTKRPGAHLIRATIGLISMSLNFQAFIILPLAEAMTIGFAAPLFATILSALVLRETVGIHRWGAVLIGFVGVMAVMQPGTSGLPLEGLAMAILAALGVAFVTVTVRQIGTTEHPATTVFWFNLAAIVALLPTLPFVAQAHPPAVWGSTAIMAIAGGLAQIWLTSSLRYAPIAVLAPIDYLQLFWAAIIGWVMWSHSPSLSTLGGGLLIAAAGIYTTLREHVLRRRALASLATPQPF